MYSFFPEKRYALDEEFFEQLNKEKQRDLVFSFINKYYDTYDTIPSLDTITETYEDIYLDDTLVKEVILSFGRLHA